MDPPPLHNLTITSPTSPTTTTTTKLQRSSTQPASPAFNSSVEKKKALMTLVKHTHTHRSFIEKPLPHKIVGRNTN